MLNVIEKYFPFMSKGKWYRFFIESDGVNYSLTESTLENTDITSNYLKLPVGYHIIDSKIDVHFTSTEANNTSLILRSYVDGSQGIALPAKAHFDHMYAYVFAYKER